MNQSAARTSFLVVLVVCGIVAAGDRLLDGGPAAAKAAPVVEDDFSQWLDHIMDRPMTASELTAASSTDADNTANAPENADSSSKADPYELVGSDAPTPTPAIHASARVSRAVIVKSGASRVRQGFGQISVGMSHLDVALLLGPPRQSDSSDRWLYAAIDARSPLRDVYAVDFTDGEVTCMARIRYVPAQPFRN